MELGYIEALRRRWDVLGIEEDGDAIIEDATAKEDEDESAESRKAVMAGAIVQTVLDNAVKCKFYPFGPRTDQLTTL